MIDLSIKGFKVLTSCSFRPLCHVWLATQNKLYIAVVISLQQEKMRPVRKHIPVPYNNVIHSNLF